MPSCAERGPRAGEEGDPVRLDLAREDRERIGVMMGSALGGIRMAEEQLEVFLSKGLRAVRWREADRR